MAIMDLAPKSVYEVSFLAAGNQGGGMCLVYCKREERG